MRSGWSLVLSAVMLSGTAFAQESVTAQSGQETRVGWIGSVGADCTANPAPAVKPSKVADHGQIKLTKGEVQTNQVPNCPGAKVPAIVVFYQSAPGFTGTDQFALTVEGGSGNSERTYTVTVE